MNLTQKIHQLFTHFKDAYDSIHRQQLYAIMEQFGIATKTVNLIKVTLRNTVNKDQIGGTLSDSFETTSGHRKGDSLSTLLISA
jgi:hypothetical protein